MCVERGESASELLAARRRSWAIAVCAPRVTDKQVLLTAHTSRQVLHRGRLSCDRKSRGQHLHTHLALTLTVPNTLARRLRRHRWLPDARVSGIHMRIQHYHWKSGGVFGTMDQVTGELSTTIRIVYKRISCWWRTLGSPRMKENDSDL